jgi:YggT family protein
LSLAPFTGHLSRVSTFLASYIAALDLMRVALFYVAAALAVVCGVDWLVRTRRLNPFGPVARFFRSSVDPMLAPVERTVVRAGGTPASAPWWALVAVVVGGILLISLMGMIGRQIEGVGRAASQGPGGVLVFLASATLALLRVALFVRVISSWIRISPYSPWIRWTYGLTEWLLAPLRRVVPTIGMIDITPIVAYYVLLIVGNALVEMLARAVL